MPSVGIFDVDVALKTSDENPVYYVQYAHARICRMLEQAGGADANLDNVDLSPLTAPTEATLLATLAREMPLLLAACYSASSMWTANAATVSPSADSDDGKVHFTPANLQNKLHRSIEAPTTARIIAKSSSAICDGPSSPMLTPTCEPTSFKFDCEMPATRIWS